MAISEGDRVLRVITIITWIPAFALLVPYGRWGSIPVPPLLIVPMTISALWGLCHINNRASTRAGNIMIDIFMLVLFIALGVPAIVFIRSYSGRRYSKEAELIMVGTFGASTMLMNL